MILHDPYALNRRWWDREWKPDPTDTAWPQWDFVLADTYQIIDDFTDKESGQYIPYDSSGEVDWDVQSKFSGSSAAIEKARESRKELKPGETLYAVPTFRDPDNKPTLKTWIRDVEENKADLRPPEAMGSRPPTLLELQQLRAVREGLENV